MPGDNAKWTAAVSAVTDRGFFPSRPAPGHLKLGPYNYWPNTGAAHRDGRPRRFNGFGLDAFLRLIDTSTTRLPRIDTTIPLRTLEREDRGSERGSDDASDDLPSPFSLACSGSSKIPRIAAPFDTSIATLPPGTREQVRALADCQLIDSVIAGAVTWVRATDLIHFTAPGCGDDLPF
ncbi:hypothetical protein [Phenylobacterium sp.]|uniref:hypothetical protein n=1 Tax=Phenylobacterium sp. TaxID=1871053 RepID=UPI002737960A|nr:hypothetical protein [Phenylobacterium sp.]MDP3870402.1 hypothetical protein [Phenylobacterium sp.]